MGVSFADISVFGTWASETSVRMYLREGDVQLTRGSSSFAGEIWQNVARLARLHEVVWLHKDADARLGKVAEPPRALEAAA